MVNDCKSNCKSDVLDVVVRWQRRNTALRFSAAAVHPADLSAAFWRKAIVDPTRDSLHMIRLGIPEVKLPRTCMISYNPIVDFLGDLSIQTLLPPLVSYS